MGKWSAVEVPAYGALLHYVGKVIHSHERAGDGKPEAQAHAMIDRAVKWASCTSEACRLSGDRYEESEWFELYEQLLVARRTLRFVHRLY